MGDGAPVLDPVAEREEVLLGPFLADVEISLLGHLLEPSGVEVNQLA